MSRIVSDRSLGRDGSVIAKIRNPLKGNHLRTMLISILIVSIMITGSFALTLVWFWGETVAEGYEGDKITINYHPFKDTAPRVNSTYNNTTIPSSITVTYYGAVASTEYNPQLWSNDLSQGGSEVLTQVSDLTTWYSIKEYAANLTYVFTGWVDDNGRSYDPGDIIKSSDVTGETFDLYATWRLLNRHSTSVPYNWSDGTPYTNLVVGPTITASSSGTRINGNYTLRNCTINVSSGYLNINKDTIIDNTTITGTKGRDNHGAGDYGIFANGNKLILGSMVKGTQNGSSEASFAQIFGGSKTSTLTKSTELIIHSGTFSNVVAGSQAGTINGNATLIVKDVNILDTLTAGVKDTTYITGSTYIYATALNMPGDTYEENNLNGGIDIPSGVSLTESTILTGGSNKGTIVGDTNVYITGTSKVWDVQGAGRGGDSKVGGTANVTIGGMALVKHIIAGSITDGLSGNSGISSNKECVKNTDIRVKDQSKVSSVFGAGYDTFYKAVYASMLNGGSIKVTVEGQPIVGYVYGGGYRGTIGTQTSPIDSITIDIRGGTILNDVFGGGRGGLDKVCHNVDGTRNWGDSYEDSTGYSVVYCRDISISVSDGAIVKGNIYGGGESVPYITTYDGITGLSGNYNGSTNICVASVIADSTTINVNGIVEGSVFGAGKGVDPNEKDEYNRHPSAYISAMDGNGDIKRIVWLTGSGSGTTVSSSVNHNNYASVDSNVTINMQGGTVQGSVYGGGSLGKVYGASNNIRIEMTDGIIQGSVYGGGMGSSNNVNAGLVDIKGISIELKGGNIQRSVYGGGELAQTYTTSAIDIRISGCEIASNVFGGGLGSSGNLSTKSNRRITLQSGSVMGSLFGSSSLGDDGISGQRYDSTVTIYGGSVEGSVYGGGFKGVMYGNTSIAIYGGSVAYSVYGGGDVGDVDPDDPVFNRTLVHGNSTILVNGTGTSLSIGRSIFGSGNSCLVSGTKDVTIIGSTLSSMDSIQNVDVLSISDSSITLSGRSDATTAQASTRYSINNIGNIILHENVVLGLRSPTDEIGGYTSEGGTESSPSNKIVLYGGLPLKVSKKDVNGDIVYGMISGHTILQTDNTTYGGAFAYGSIESDGNFVVLREGNYIESYTRDYTNPLCRCWYIAGNVTYMTTMIADGRAIPQKQIDIPMQNSDSYLVFTGFDKVIPDESRFILKDDVVQYPDFSIKVYGDAGSVMSGGLTLSDAVSSIGSDYANYIMSVEGNLPFAKIELNGASTLRYTGSVATVTIHLKEMKKNTDDTYSVVNSIDVIVSIHTEATEFPIAEGYDVVIGTKDGKGNTDFIINRSFNGYTATVERIEGAGTFSKVTMESYLNSEGTLGWATPLSGKMTLSTLGVGRTIGDLTGSFSATIRFTADYDSASDIPAPVATLAIKLSNGNAADDKHIQIRLSVREVDSHTVTFVNMDESLTREVRTVISVYDNEIIPESQKPHTWDHFINWYSDVGRNNVFDFSSPINVDTVVYSSYRYTVHFDDGFGGGWTSYVEITASGSSIVKPTNPVRASYTFDKWVDANGVERFTEGSENITSDMTFYAVWIGEDVTVNLVVRENGAVIYTMVGSIEFGKTYSTMRFTSDGVEYVNIDNATEIVKGEYPEKGRFIRWVYDNGTTTGVYSDTVSLSNATHTLYAEFTNEAITVRFLEDLPQDYKTSETDTSPGRIYWYGDWHDLIRIQAPTEMVVFKRDEGYTFKPGNASFTGYTLDHWTYTLDGTVYRINPTETVTLTTVSEGSTIDVYPHWKHIDYDFNIENPRGGSIVATKTTNGASTVIDSGSILWHGDSVRIEYLEGGGYTFSRWGQTGTSVFDSFTINPTNLMITSDTIIHVILSGVYEATVELSVNGVLDDSRTLQLRSVTTTDTYKLTATADGRYVNSSVRFGTYVVQLKNVNGTWDDVSEYTISGPDTLCQISLYTITINNGDGKVRGPEFSLSGKAITIDVDEGYEATITGKVPGSLVIEGTGPYTFTMPSAAVELTFDVSMIEYTLNFDFDGGTYSGTVPVTKTITYFGTYDTLDIEGRLTKAQYTFGGWSVWVGGADQHRTIHHGDPIAVRADHTLKAIWIKNGDATYTIEVYQMDLNGAYELTNTVLRSDTIGKTVTVDPERIDGFITPASVSGVITADGNLVLEIRYDREKYQVTFRIHYQDDFYDVETVVKNNVYFGTPISDIGYTVKAGFLTSETRINDAHGAITDTIPSSNDGKVTIYVKADYVRYNIVYNIGEGTIDPPYAVDYVISKTAIPLPTPIWNGYKFGGWIGIGTDPVTHVPAYHTGNLALTAKYDRLPVITIDLNAYGKGISIDGGEFVDGRYVLNDLTQNITLRYSSATETIYKWIINGVPVDPAEDGSFTSEISSDTFVMAFPKYKDETPAPLVEMKVILGFIESDDGDYSTILQDVPIYRDFTIDLSRYGFGTGSSITFGNNGEVDIVGLDGLTGYLLIRESTDDYNVEIVVYVSPKIVDAEVSATSIMTLNYGRSGAPDPQTISNYILPSEKDEDMIE